VKTDSSSAPAPGDEIVAALNVWRNSLVNLTGVNRLIQFKHSKTGSLDLTAPIAQEILEGLRGRRLWSFVGVHDDEHPVDEHEQPAGICQVK
jgi:hypothetical protein